MAMKMLKQISAIIFFAPVIFLLQGCPVETKYPLEVNGKEKIDLKLIGTWSNDDETAEVKKATIRQIDDYTYYVRVDEKGEEYQPDETTFRGWLCTVSGKKFLIIQPVSEGKAKESSYL